MKKGKNNGISAIDFFCIGFGAIVGVGWAVSINRWMANSGGPLPSALGYIFALIVIIPVALCYCELCPMLPVTGGGLAYAYRAFGENLAFISGWATLGAFITIIPWEAIYIADILSILFPILKTGSPIYTLAGSDIHPGCIATGTIISFILFIINRRGVSASALLQRFLCFFLIGSGLLAIICAALKLNINNLKPFYKNIGLGTHNSFLGGALSILATVPFFLAGFETIPLAIEEAGGKVKSAGRTVVLSVVSTCIFYATLLAILGGAMPWQEFTKLSTPAASLMFKNLYGGAFGVFVYSIILLGAICGLLTSWNGFMMASSQLIMSMARARMIPSIFAKQHPKYNTPYMALLVCFILSIIGPFLGIGLIDPLTTFSAAGFVLSWMITSYCLIKLRKSEPNLDRPYKIPGGTKIAWFSGITMSLLFILLFFKSTPVYMGSTAVLLFIVWMTIGITLYLLNSKERKLLSGEERLKNLFAKMNHKEATTSKEENF